MSGYLQETAGKGRSKPVTIPTLQAMRDKGEKISMLTCYDASFAALMDRNGVEVVLIGDSLGMVCQGHTSTLPVTSTISRITLPVWCAAIKTCCSWQTCRSAVMQRQRLPSSMRYD